jgi:hypothetical protein
LKIFQLQGEDFGGTQTVEQQQTHQGKIAQGVEGAPELFNLLVSEWSDDALGLLQTQSRDEGAAGPSVAEWRAPGAGAVKMRGAGRNLLAVMETIQAMQHRKAVIHGLRGGLGLLVELKANVIEEPGLGEFGKRMLRPAGEVK